MHFWSKLVEWVFGKQSTKPGNDQPAQPPETASPEVSSPPTPTPTEQSGSAMPGKIERVATPTETTSAAPPPAPAHPEPIVRRRDGPRPITIGLDFGTHSTKIVLRSRGSESASLLRIDKPQQGYPSFASPSLVKVIDNKVCFGSKALEITGGKLYRSLKVQLLPPDGEDGCAPVFPSRLTPDLLVAWYLSWVLNRIRLALQKYYPHAAPRLYLNVAAPMNHIENESLKTRYLGIIQAAWESVFGQDPFPVQQGTSVTELCPRFKDWLEKEVPGRETRTFEILPETVAPIVSLSFDPRMDPGMYMIVDMGAGTTELSVNHVEEAGADQRVLCYEDESFRFGGDNFEWLENSCGDGSSLREEKCRLVERFTQHFRRTWGTGYQKDGMNPAPRDKWRRFRALLTGGGAHRPEIERAIRNALPMTPWPIGELYYHAGWHEPTAIDWTSEGDKQSSSLLAVAHGLSVPRQQWPVFFVPGEVEVQEAPEATERLPAYWYVD